MEGLGCSGFLTVLSVGLLSVGAITGLFSTVLIFYVIVFNSGFSAGLSVGLTVPGKVTGLLSTDLIVSVTLV